MSPLVKSNWKTHCLGRHLVDAPADAKVRATFKYNGNSIERLPAVFNKDSFDKLVALREAELKSERHNTRGVMLIRRVNRTNGSSTLISWSLPTWEKGYTFDSYFPTGNFGRAYQYKGDVGLDYETAALERLDQYSRSFALLRDGEIPNEPGFCIDGAVLKRSKLNPESFSAAIWLAGKPDVYLSISAFVQGKVEPGLLERAGGFLPGLLSVAGGIKTLRKGKHPVGPIYGEEILTAGTENGKRLYAFKWEAPGKANSLAEPNINVSMGVVESQYETNAESFASDEEAIELWDAIVDSIRLRPGAV